MPLSFPYHVNLPSISLAEKGECKKYDMRKEVSSVYTTVSDGKGGKIRVKKEKAKKEKKGKKGKEIADFSDASTDSDAVDLSNMTEEEKKKYFEEKAKRKAEREKRRREKYGDKYDEMMAAHEKRGRGGKDGNEADSESEYEVDPVTGRKKKKLKKTQDGEFEYEYDAFGRVVRKKRIGKGGDGGDSGSEYEYEYDEHGNLIKEKKKGKGGNVEGYEYVYDSQGRLIKKIRKGKHEIKMNFVFFFSFADKDGNLIEAKKTKGKDNSNEDDGNYFEVDEKGQVKLRQGKKKIDLSKLTDEDLIRLGIDPNLSKQDIARLLRISSYSLSGFWSRHQGFSMSIFSLEVVETLCFPL
ncbi:hypothetical protein PoB_004090800 [Plakobranchus ocellatus]|uniref:Uncharacterized protein n=1 Tax=Plakobranchus ocellatus TaxID=259542 RepID=A0AAV4B5N9_9GAST|nr:hypothetical protein PoB_004090800 [Plakobranchus ocellatus]